jgi:hypothetical protein
MRRHLLGWLLLAASASLADVAAAQTDANTIPAARNFQSPERFILELRGGPYKPDLDGGESFDKFFAGDNGLLLGVQLSYIVYRLPDIGYVTAGGGFGWSNYDGTAVSTETGEAVSEETTLTLMPISAVGSVRIDALARRFQLPFIFTGKLGFQWVHWDTDTGKRDDASGWSLGLSYGLQLALDLDVFDSAAARSMDEEWGINHSFLFVEIFGFAPTSASLPIGDTTWALGLGFNF